MNKLPPTSSKQASNNPQNDEWVFVSEGKGQVLACERVMYSKSIDELVMAALAGQDIMPFISYIC